MDRPGILENIEQVRRDEMAAAAKALGVEQTWLGFVDSGLPEGDPLPPLPEGSFATVPLEEATEALVRVVRDFRPHVMITYDEHGGYPHPDHIRCHEVSVAAFDQAGDPDAFPGTGEPWTVDKLYYTHGFIRDRMVLVSDEFEKHGQESPFKEWLEVGSLAWRSDGTRHHTDHLRRLFPAARRRLAGTRDTDRSEWCFFAVPLEWQQRLWPTEEFELAKTRVTTSIPETDLFTGIEE